MQMCFSNLGNFLDLLCRFQFTDCGLIMQPALRSGSVQMSMSMDRRQVVQTAAAAAVALPLAANAYCDNAGIKCTTDQINKNAAPIVCCATMRALFQKFDPFGCSLMCALLATFQLLRS